jgi:hypothetical protein
MSQGIDRPDPILGLSGLDHGTVERGQASPARVLPGDAIKPPRSAAQNGEAESDPSHRHCKAERSPESRSPFCMAARCSARSSSRR